jgi:hypothetical protein
MVERRKSRETGADWVESIASKSKRSVDEVKQALERYNIKPKSRNRDPAPADHSIGRLQRSEIGGDTGANRL